MKLITPAGVRVSVSDAKGEELLTQGYTRAGAVQSAPAAPAASEEKPVVRRRKTTTTK